MTGSIEPKECSALERCKSEGLDLPHSDLYLVIVIGVSWAAFGCVLSIYRYLNKLFPFNNKAGGEEVANLVDVTITSVSTSLRLVKHSVAAEDQERKVLRQVSGLTTPKPAYTIDVKFNNLQRTLPNGICIMQGVTGELKGGQFTAIMGPSGAGKSTVSYILINNDRILDHVVHITAMMRYSTNNNNSNSNASPSPLFSLSQICLLFAFIFSLSLLCSLYLIL